MNRRPVSYYSGSDYYDESITADTVHVEDEAEPSWSGLYDARGAKLFRKPAPKLPIGFHHR